MPNALYDLLNSVRTLSPPTLTYFVTRYFSFGYLVYAKSPTITPCSIFSWRACFAGTTLVVCIFKLAALPSSC